MALTIASFNLYTFSSSENRAFPKDYAEVADMILRTKADVIALQEVIDERALNEVLSQLNGHSSAKCEWRTYFDKKQTWRNNREGYAFIWNEKRLTLARDDDGQVILPELMTRYTSLKRPPLVGRFAPVNAWDLDIELCIINTHIIFNPDKYQSEHSEFFGATAMRVFEYSKIAKQLYPAVGNRPRTYAVVAGDYNLKSSILAKANALFQAQGDVDMASIQTDRSTIKVCEPTDDSTVQNQNPDENASQAAKGLMAVYNGVIRFLGLAGEEKSIRLSIGKTSQREAALDGDYANDYDHFSFSRRRVGGYLKNAHRIDIPSSLFPLPQHRFHSYKQDVSDHVPVVATLDLSSSKT